MTTIVYRDRCIAYDSRSTCDGTIASDSSDKHVKRDSAHFFFCGTTADFEPLIHYYFSGEPFEIEASALVYDGGQLFIFGADKDRSYKTPLLLDELWAMGSGEQFAWTAMDLGCTAKESVDMAKKRDVYTGGRTRVFKF